MHDHAAREIAVDHLTARKNAVAGDDPIEFAFLKETEVKKAVEQGDLGEIHIAKGAPCHIGGGNYLLAQGKIIKLTAGQ